ncbi:hypothetical protein J7E93_36000 [Streptomyces sp. ISL-36]|uniref:hypothetical protein n=1 Tax=Streptomyces sp. ISL-36 TaxID=2819182 RepID=UPI001BE7F70C|nr:hypothetical protein [Streptomyces sp. ISL-36]MBT2445392.1 hypothetical protein [Streptomyces sp. ISL-36]
MHADVHLQLHHLNAAELHRAAADSPPRSPVHASARASARASIRASARASVRASIRTQLGWTLVALGLRLAVPATERPVTLTA